MATAPLHETPLTAGAYLRRQREAAGLSVHDIAVVCTSSPVAIPAAIVAICDAEDDQSDLTPADLHRLCEVFPFDASAYLALASGI